MDFLNYFFIYLIVLFFGLAVGSFLKCLLDRLERNEKLNGRSNCPNCGHVLIWKDLIPIFSFLFLGGKCRYCRKKISFQYPLAEISTALIFIMILNFKIGILNHFEFFNLLNAIDLLFLFYIASSLIVIFIYDIKFYLIPDRIIFPAIIVAIIYRIFNFILYNFSELYQKSSFLFTSTNGGLEVGIFLPLINYIFAAMIASGFFLSIFLISKGRWMGFGDVKLALLLGLLLGFPNILCGIFLAFLFGAIIGLGLIILEKKGLKSQMPFAPFLIIGTFLSMFWGENIIQWYIKTIMF
jgi:prepilin signal peptidase PulO-like enzyme (type II secretory pathway)